MTIHRNNIFQFRLTDNELEAISIAAAAAGCKPSQWTRSVALAVARSLIPVRDPIRVRVGGGVLVMSPQGYTIGFEVDEEQEGSVQK